MKISDKYLRGVCNDWHTELSYNEEMKCNVHKRTKRCLRLLAEYIGIPSDKYRIRSNLAGCAVSGEVTLHSDPVDPNGSGIYIQIGQMDPFSSETTGSILYRRCKNLTDYTGGGNRWALLDDYFHDNSSVKEFANICQSLMEKNYEFFGYCR